MSPEPTQIGSYEIVKTLGKGGMGAVYLARDPAIDRLVAIKLLREGLDSPELRERFSREARSAGRLRHPNIVTIFQAGEHNKQPFIVMEYIPGKSLAETIREQVAISVPAKLKIIEEVCSGLAYAHKSGIVHRDIKPPNIVLDSDGSAKILDFGIARIAEVADQGLTRVGTRLGTPNYMSPEQVSAGTADLRSDIFAVGLVMYELLTYSRAFSGDMMEVLQSILSGEPEPIEKFCPRLDPEISAIVRKAIQKRPEDRYQDLAVMRREMERIRTRMDDQLEDGGGAAATAAMPTPVPSAISAIPVIPVINAAEVARPDDATVITPRPVFAEAATLIQPVPVAIPVNMPAPSVPAPSVPAPSAFMPPPGPRPQVAAPVGPAPKAQAAKSKPINPLLWLAPVAAAVVLGVIWFAFLRQSPAQIASSGPAPTTVAAADQPAAAPVEPVPAAPVEAAPIAEPPPAPLAAINGRLTVRSTPTGATVQVDGKNIGTTTLTLSNLARGAHTVRVTLDGYVTQQRQVRISEASPTASLTLTLAPVAVAAAPAPPAAPIEPPAEVARVEAPAAPPPAPVDPDTAAIQSVLNQYVAGYEALDPAAIKRAWPNAGNLTLTGLTSYQLSLLNVTITVRGATATVECVRQIKYQSAAGRVQDLNAKTVFTLRRTNGNWLIDRVQ